MIIRFGLLIFFSSLLISGKVFTQNTDTIPEGHIEFIEPVGLPVLIEKLKEINTKNPDQEIFFRVQFYSDAGNNSRERTSAKMNAFKSEFPDIPVYMTYKQPIFKLRAGDCKNMEEAKKLQKEISRNYSGTFIIIEKMKNP